MCSSSSTFNGGMCLWREVQAKLENCPRNLPCFVRFCLFLVPYVSASVFCFCRETNYVALSHRGKPMEHSSAKVQRLACSILCFLCRSGGDYIPGSPRTGRNRFFNPGFGGFGSMSSRKLFTIFFALNHGTEHHTW